MPIEKLPGIIEAMDLREEKIINPRNIQFELCFRESKEEGKEKIEFEPVGEFQYFSNNQRPIAKKYKLFLPERYRDNKTMRTVFEKMGSYLADDFSRWTAPTTEQSFSAALFGGTDDRWGMVRPDNFFFFRLPYSLHIEDSRLSADDYKSVLKSMDNVEIDVEKIFPPYDLPFNEETYKNFWQYKVFTTIPSNTPPCDKEKFSPPILRVKINEELLKAARDEWEKAEKIAWENFRQKKEKIADPIQLADRYRCIYGIGADARPLDQMAYFPEISGSSPNHIEFQPRGVGYEYTASSAPSVPSQGWRVVFPEGTPPESAAIFMTVLQTWDGMNVLDDLTSTAEVRVERAFMDAEEKFSSESYAKFKEWVKDKSLRTASMEEVQSGASDGKLYN